MMLKREQKEREEKARLQRAHLEEQKQKLAGACRRRL